MLDGLLGRSFSAKCKSSIKLIKARIDAIRRRRNAMQKYLRKDIADLLKNGLDINAYGRAEGLLVELNLSSCYDLVEHFCGCVPRHLSVMQKQSGCPEECREAVSSLMFAAARFADLPELRDLREIFTEKYRDTVDLFKNQEFVEKLALKPPTVESKLQLMRDIAQESSIKWDSTAFEQKISTPPVSVQDRPKRHGSLHDSLSKPYTSTDDSALKRETQDGSSRGRQEQTKDGFKPHIGSEGTVPKRNKEDASSRARRELSDNGHKASNQLQETTLKSDKEDVLYRGRREPNDEIKLHNASKVTVLKRDNQEVMSRGRREHNINGYQPHNGVEEPIAKKDNLDAPSHGRREYIDGRLKPRDGRDENVPKRENQDASSRGRRDLNEENGGMQGKDNWEILSRKRHELNEDRLRVRDARKDHVRKTENLANSSHDRKEHADDTYIRHGDRENASHRRDDQGISSHRRREHAFVAHAGSDQTIHAEFKEKSNEEANTVKPHYNVIPPPYVRPNAGKYGTRNSMTDHNSTTLDTPVFDRDLNARSERAHKEPTNERQEFGLGRASGHRDENGLHREDDSVGERKPKPMSVRRRHLPPPPGHPEYNSDRREGEEVLKSNPSDRRRDSRRGLQHALYDDDAPKDEEEKMMDKLLMHYSKKPSKFEEVQVRAGLNPPPGYNDFPERKQKRDGSRMNMDSARPPARAVSLPPEPVTPTESRRGPARATSFQPEVAAHVHPNLPDYQDLAARVASLRSR